MPCSGPSQDLAYLKGDKFFLELTKKLDKEYFIPFIENSTTEQKFFYRNTLEAQEKLREAIRELFWADACDSF